MISGREAMFDFLDGLTGHLSFLHWLPSLHGWALPPEALSISAVFSGAGAVVLSKFTSNVGFITMPINYCALFFGALASNYLLSGVHLPIDPDFQAPMVLAVGGMMVTALSLMMFMKEE
jgi:hypothetical protein